MLMEELKSVPNAPELQKDVEGDAAQIFSKDFVLRVTRFTHRYHMISNVLIKKQNEDARLAAIEADNDLEYARAFYSKDINTMRMATEIEDIIFDYFGIVEMQFEAANQFYKKDTKFQENK